MSQEYYSPIFELNRGDTIESIHFGAVAIMDRDGALYAWYGDPEAVSFLRSTAKPFQALPFIERGGDTHFNLGPQEIALICASHSGTDEHVRIAESIQTKAGISQGDLLCGVHPPFHQPTLEAMRQRGELPLPNRHNCSGKHSGMLAFSRLIDAPIEDYIDQSHAVQQEILATFAQMCELPVGQVALGIDGCSAPNFAVPLWNSALAYAHLCDPVDLETSRAAACRRIVQAMTGFPEMVAGPDKFDTLLMEAYTGKIVSKGGAEGYQGIGLLPDALYPGSPGIGIAIKISDGDQTGRARGAVALEVLRQLGVLQNREAELLSKFGPQIRVQNWRKLDVGMGRPTFRLHFVRKPHP